jgi:hypothetical protein
MGFYTEFSSYLGTALLISVFAIGVTATVVIILRLVLKWLRARSVADPREVSEGGVPPSMGDSRERDPVYADVEPTEPQGVRVSTIVLELNSAYNSHTAK